ncbi:glycoside hydrolase family 43 protein [Mangrovibacterium diazotrophicum]|uniref:Glycosyl hydrolase family 43 n=1 Tax=Mangrovibacterium diazotrophicum TaxID=1261403 RepID=A0A419W328_9BACT|nr:glycoside hydrolase family 43 protein [Mangrovibacterium diazotrophicum]RKD89834.1 glycosyl hydrolase family 43 [Mangrovibacterium diazotrophicum]
MNLFLQLALFLSIFACNKSSDDGAIVDEKPNPVTFGDPFILEHDGTFYMYGTSNAEIGIQVFQSTDLKHWSGPAGERYGYALYRDDVWGNYGFWAPEIYELDNRFYMFFSVQEHIAVAVSDSPLGPFVQENKTPLLTTQAIDTHLFIDEDGRKYLYYVAFTDGNVIWMCEMNDDYLSIKENTIQECFGVSQPWENSQKEPVAKVTEGPYILKHNGLYYLVYSANHFASPDYGIGYATAPSPTGPWTKYEGNPIVASDSDIVGTGHCAFFTDLEGNLNVVYHSHYSKTSVQPRLVHINQCRFVTNPNGGPDILEIVAPRIDPILEN